MKKCKKSPVNLSLSPRAIKQGRDLKKLLNRPSLSNVVETLIEEKAAQLKAA